MNHLGQSSNEVEQRNELLTKLVTKKIDVGRTKVMQDVLNLTNTKKDLLGITSGKETDHFFTPAGKGLYGSSLTMDATEKFIFTHNQ
jgi:hypothetical protein